MPDFAMKNAGAWVLLPPGKDVTRGTGSSAVTVSYASLASWGTTEREAFGAIEVPAPPSPPNGKVEASRTLGGTGRPAWTVTYQDAPPAPVPSEVSNVQGHAVLIMYGIRNEAQAAVNGIANETERALAQLAFDRGAFVRTSPMVTQLSTGLGLTSGQVDEMFRTAATIIV